jgi:hypothetical protein
VICMILSAGQKLVAKVATKVWGTRLFRVQIVQAVPRVPIVSKRVDSDSRVDLFS